MRKILLISIPLVLVGYFFLQGIGSVEDYQKEIEMYWQDKHEFYANSEGSPFVQKDVQYKKVAYFTPDPAYKVSATLDRFTKREIIQLGNSDGTVTNYLKFAKANFKIDGKEQSLLILKALGFGAQYLTAFGDDTSGETTYGGGRYLDLAIGKADQVEIDFNKAYNPYCAYFTDFTCPLPPRENLLSVAIPVGEKDYAY